MNVIENVLYGPLKENLLDIYLPERPSFDVVVYFHGGGLEKGDKSGGRGLAEFLSENGVAVVSVDYRIYPNARFPDFVEDAAMAVAWCIQNMPNYGHCRRFFVSGSSAGGYLSMMLCFDKRYLNACGVELNQISGYIHDAGQPTSHFNVLREKRLDTRRVIVDETAPLFFVGAEPEYPPMLFLVSDNDMPGRYEQTQLMLATMKHFGHGANSVKLQIMNGTHCHYVGKRLGEVILGFVENTK